MNLDSVRSFKQAVSEEVVQAQVAMSGEPAAARSFFAATEPPMPEGMGLGVASDGTGGYRLAIRTNDPAAGAAMAARVNGEADLRILTVRARPTALELQKRVRPLEPGAQVNIKGANFVGTLGAFVSDARGTYALSNSHVFADMGRTPVGTPIGQPFGDPADLVGVLDRFIPYSMVSPNLVDCALMRLDKTTALTRWNAALGDNIKGARILQPSDLGTTVTKIGRTTGVRTGNIVAVEVDGLPVDMGGQIVRFSDQVEISGGPTTDFSAAGDSGSLILDKDGWAVALLFAGGSDGTQDLTFGNYLTNVLAALGVELAI